MFTRLETESTATATKYEKPEEENRVLLQSLGPEVEMTTFKTNVPQQQESDEKSDVLLKIVCVGDYTAGADTKGLLIRDYMRTRTTRTTTCRFRCRCSSNQMGNGFRTSQEAFNFASVLGDS